MNFHFCNIFFISTFSHIPRWKEVLRGACGSVWTLQRRVSVFSRANAEPVGIGRNASGKKFRKFANFSYISRFFLLQSFPFCGRVCEYPQVWLMGGCMRFLLLKLGVCSIGLPNDQQSAEVTPSTVTETGAASCFHQ